MNTIIGKNEFDKNNTCHNQGNDTPLIEISAGIIIIGDEILNAEVADVNAFYIIKELKRIGISTKEVRIIEDNEENIINSIKDLRKNSYYIFTTGGIGPTHDDITSEAVAKALSLTLEYHPEGKLMLEKYTQRKHLEYNKSMLKMVLFPKGAQLIKSDKIIMPGFYIDNIFVLAGVPEIMKEMLKAVIPTLSHGNKIYSFSFNIESSESYIAEKLEQFEKQFEKVKIGSYPYQDKNTLLIKITARSDDIEELNRAKKSFKSWLENSGCKFSFID